jgi:hypothetical protein
VTTTAELADRVFDGILETYDPRAINGSPLRAEELARKTGVHSRYAREWLEQQVVYGFVVGIDILSSENDLCRFYRLLRR